MQAIMLVESVDGQSALLGRPRSLSRRGPVLTCLSGFIEQGESIEEAVRMTKILYPIARVFLINILDSGNAPSCVISVHRACIEEHLNHCYR